MAEMRRRKKTFESLKFPFSPSVCYLCFLLFSFFFHLASLDPRHQRQIHQILLNSSRQTMRCLTPSSWNSNRSVAIFQAPSCLSQTAHTVKHGNKPTIEFLHFKPPLMAHTLRKLFKFYNVASFSSSFFATSCRCQAFFNVNSIWLQWLEDGKRYSRNVDSVVMCVFFPSRADCRLVEWKFNIWCQNDKFTVQFTSMWFKLAAYCFQFFFSVSYWTILIISYFYWHLIWFTAFVSGSFMFYAQVMLMISSSLAGVGRKKPRRQLSLHFRIEEGRNLCANK